MRKLLLLFLLIFSLCNETVLNANPKFSTAGFYAINDSPRKMMSFNNGWRFHKGKSINAEKIDFDDSSWEKAVVPHGLEILPENASGCRNYQGEAWYRKQFTIDRAKGTDRLFLYFEAIMGKSKIWINGKQVCDHFGGYLPFAIDITDVVNYNDKINVVAVMADNSDDVNYLPGKNQDGLDFSYLGGIYRDCYLLSTKAVHITLPQLSRRVAGGGVFVATLEANAKNRSAKINVRTEVENSQRTAAAITIKSTLETSDFKEIKSLSRKVTVKAGSTCQLDQILNVKDVDLWHPNYPHLHYIKTEILVGNKVIDSFRTRFGIRTIEMMGPKGLYVNGEPIDYKLIGANRHQDYVYVGNALPNSGQWRDVKLLREGGCNIIRAAHYPQDDAFYDACDELGMFATSATPGWHFFNFKNPTFEERLYRDTRDLVRKDRNHPCMLMWETALNETPQQPANAMNTMHRYAHEEYPFNGFYTVTDYDEAKKAGLDMYYHGNDDKINSFTRECGDGGEVDNWYSHNAVTRVKMEWGEAALLGQSEKLVETLNSLHSTPKVRLGGALWAGIEHQRGYHPDPFWGGLLNMYRLPKYSYYLWKSQYDVDYKICGKDVGPMIFVTNELTQLSKPEMLIYSNCDELRLIYNGKELAKQKPSTLSKYNHLPHPPFIFDDVFHLMDFKTGGNKMIFAKGLVVEGYVNGKLAITQTKLYPLRSEGLNLEIASEGIDLVANGSDFVPVRCSVIDHNGSKKVLASEEIYFTVEGEGEIIGGVNNCANPMKTQFGVATILVRATNKPGDIIVNAYSNGLKSAQIKFKSIPNDVIENFDEAYAKASKHEVNKIQIISNANDNTEKSGNEESLHKRIKELELDIVGKEQEIMELRSTQNKK